MDIYISKIRPTTLVLLPALLGDVDLLLNNHKKKKKKNKGCVTLWPCSLSMKEGCLFVLLALPSWWRDYGMVAISFGPSNTLFK
jgi:hypothetical protein